MNDEHVSRELFDETVKRLETRINGLDDTAAVAISDLHNRIDDIKDRIEDMRHSQNMTIARWGIVIAICICAVQVAISLLLR